MTTPTEIEALDQKFTSLNLLTRDSMDRKFTTLKDMYLEHIRKHKELSDKVEVLENSIEKTDIDHIGKHKELSDKVEVLESSIEKTDTDGKEILAAMRSRNTFSIELTEKHTNLEQQCNDLQQNYYALKRTVESKPGRDFWVEHLQNKFATLENDVRRKLTEKHNNSQQQYNDLQRNYDALKRVVASKPWSDQLRDKCVTLENNMKRIEAASRVPVHAALRRKVRLQIKKGIVSANRCSGMLRKGLMGVRKMAARIRELERATSDTFRDCCDLKESVHESGQKAAQLTIAHATSSKHAHEDQIVLQNRMNCHEMMLEAHEKMLLQHSNDTGYANEKINEHSQSVHACLTECVADMNKLKFECDTNCEVQEKIDKRMRKMSMNISDFDNNVLALFRAHEKQILDLENHNFGARQNKGNPAQVKQLEVSLIIYEIDTYATVGYNRL